MLSLKKHELFITQSKNAAIKPTAPTIIANITKFKLDKIIATKSAIEKNINPINQGHLTNLFKNIANIMLRKPKNNKKGETEYSKWFEKRPGKKK